MTDRTRLPNRRPNTTHHLEVGPSASGAYSKFEVTFGHDPASGKIKEVFVTQNKIGSDVDAMLSDAAILASRCLQAGMTVTELAGSMGRLGDDFEGGHAMRPATAIGAALDLAHFLEAGE